MRGEGYLLIDNRAAGEGIKETATMTCGHCKTVVVMNPLRIRERANCFKCDHYICDLCAAAKECKPWGQVVDEVKDGKVIVPTLARPIGGVITQGGAATILKE